MVLFMALCFLSTLSAPSLLAWLGKRRCVLHALPEITLLLLFIHIVNDDASESKGDPILKVVVLFHFISRAKKGAQYEPVIRSPDPVEMEELASVGRGWVRIVV
jgi:hypothetical protein